MFDAVFSQFLDDLLQATAIWSVLLIFAIAALSVLLARSKEGERPRAAAAIDAHRLAAQAQDLARYVREVNVAADRAAAMARRRRDEWLAAQVQAEAAWQRYDQSEVTARRLDRAAAFPTPKMRSTRAERKRYLHRAAMSACSHRLMSALELSDVLAHRDGWDPKRHPVDQEIVLQRAVRDGLLESYHTAAEGERAAWQAADIAVAASASLRREAIEAAGRARHVQFACDVAQRRATVRSGPLKSARKIGQLLLPAGHN